MPLKNGNTVSVERRVDLASLFCMIGRHGPAVALAVIAMVSVLAGFVIYRNVRGKRRKATAAAAAAAAADGDGEGNGDGDGTSPAGAEGDASVMHEWQRSVESTVNDDGSSDVKEDVDLTRSDLRIRHRRAASEKIPAPCSPPESGVRAPGFERTDAEEAACRVAAAYAEEVIKGALGELHAGCVKEPQPMDADRREQGAAAGPLFEETRMVSASECQEYEDIFDETSRREDNFQCALNNPVCFQLTSHMSDDDDGLRDETTNGVGSNSEEPVCHIEDVSVPWLYDGKDEEFEREATDGNTRLSPEGESRNESEEAEEHRLDHLLVGQLAEVQSSAFPRSSNRPSVTDEAPPPVWYSDCDEDGGPAGEGVVREDHSDSPSAQFAERAAEIELEGGNRSEEGECFSVALSAALDCLSPAKADHLAGLSAAVGIAEVDDLSLDRQPLHKEDPTVPSLDTNSIVLQGDVNAVLAEERVDQWPSRDWQSAQTKTADADFSKVATDAAPVPIEALNPRLCQVDLPSMEQFALMDYDVSCAGEESGISSMTVTPDAGNEYDVIFGNTAVPLVHSDLKSERQTEAQNGLFADDADTSVIGEDAAGVALGPRPSHLCRPPRSERAARTVYESFAFGHEIEDSYHRAVDRFAAQIAGSVTRFTEKHSGVSVVVRTKEKRKGGSADVKEAAKSAKEKEEDYEKTEISIMEATMDHNEWIMDGHCQAFPWMNRSASDETESNQLPSEECQDLHAEVQNVDVTFSVHYVTQSPYQRVGVVGNQQALGNWAGFVPLENTVDGHWAAAVSLPAESHVEWKFVVVEKGEVCRWEECANRLLDTGSGDELLLQKCWARL